MPEPPHLPPIADAPLSVLLTAANAQPHLDDLLDRWTRQLDKLERDYEVLLIDDGSTDATAVRAEALMAQYPRLRVLRHETALGIGAALKTGLAAAQYPLVCCCPCEPGYQPADLKQLLDRIDKVHLVTGFRTAAGNPLKRYQPSRGYRWFVRWVFGVRVTDADCAFRLYRRSIFARIPIQSKGGFVQAEILAKANFTTCMIDEVPVSYRPPATAATHSIRRDAWRVFSFPNFGPAKLGSVPSLAGAEEGTREAASTTDLTPAPPAVPPPAADT